MSDATLQIVPETTAADPPAVVCRPLLAEWLWRRDISLADAGEALSVSGEAIRKYCLPFGNPTRQIPGRGVMDRIVAYTRGEVTPGSFYAPEARP